MNADVEITVRQAHPHSLRETLKEVDKRGFHNILAHLNIDLTHALLKAVSTPTVVPFSAICTLRYPDVNAAGQRGKPLTWPNEPSNPSPLSGNPVQSTIVQYTSLMNHWNKGIAKTASPKEDPAPYCTQMTTVGHPSWPTLGLHWVLLPALIALRSVQSADPSGPKGA